jgi:hypothetical protein
MEEVFTRVPHTDTPAVYARTFGQGRVVYFPFDLDRTFWEVLSTDHGTVLRNAVAWAFNATQPVTVTGKGMLDVSLWQQNGSITVHMVNLTNPMMMKGPVRELIPSPPQRVTLRLPNGKRLKNFRLLVAGTQPASRAVNTTVTFDIPPIELHEVLALDLE